MNFRELFEDEYEENIYKKKIILTFNCIVCRKIAINLIKIDTILTLERKKNQLKTK